MSDKNSPEVYSTVPFSIPSHFPGEEDFRMNGFAFSDQLGIVVAWRRDDDPSLDPLNNLRNGFAKHNSTSSRRPRSSNNNTKSRLGQPTQGD